MAVAAPTKSDVEVITDPVTKKQFSRDTSVPGSTYQEYTPPPVNTMNVTDLGKSRGVYSTYFPAPTAAAGLASTAMSSRDSYLARIAAETDQLAEGQANDKGVIRNLFKKLSGSNRRKVDAYESEGIYDQKRDIDELTSQMESEGRRFDLQIEALEKNNPDGKLKSGIDIDRNNLSREKARTLADLGIALNARTRNYETAKAIIDQKAEAETEDLKIELDGLRFFYNENANRMDKNEATLLQAQIREAENEYQEKRDLRRDIGNLQLAAAKNGAGASVIRAIGSAVDIASAIAASSGFLTEADAGSGVTIPSAPSKSFEQFLAEKENALGMNLVPGGTEYNKIKAEYDSTYGSGNVNLGRVKKDEALALTRAGLDGAPAAVQSYFLNTDNGFRQYVSRLAAGGNVPTTFAAIDKMYQDYLLQEEMGAGGMTFSVEDVQ